MYIKAVLLFVLLLVTQIQCISANRSKQSQILLVENALKNAAHDSSKLKLLYDFCNQEIDSDTATTRKYATKIIEICNKYGTKNNESSMITFYKIAAYNKLGEMYVSCKNYEQALPNISSVSKIIHLAKDSDQIAIYYSNYSLLQRQSKQFNAALKNINKAITINQTRQNVGKLKDNYITLSDYYIDLMNYDSSLIALQMLLTLATKTNDSSRIAIAYNNYGVIYFLRNDFNKAIENYKKSLIYSQQSTDLLGLRDQISTIGNIGYLLNRTNRYNEAIPYLKKAYDMALKTNIAREKRRLSKEL